MKKIYSIILLVCLVFTLTSCGDGNAQGGKKAVTQKDVWAELDGLWLCTNTDNGYAFVWITTENGTPCFNWGLLFSEYMDGGATADFAQSADGIYIFKVNCPEVEGNDIIDGRDAATYSVIVTVIEGETKTINVTIGDTFCADYVWNAKGLYSVDEEAVLGN